MIRAMRKGSQLLGMLGMAMGLSPKKVGVNENFSDSMTLIREKGLA